MTVIFTQIKKEEEYQSYLQEHPELGAAIELFFENLCTDGKTQDDQVKSSRLAKMIEFFTSPNLEELVTVKLKNDK